MDGQAVDRRAELRKAVDFLLAAPPLVVLGPVPAELLEIRQRHTLRPVRHRGRFGPPGSTEAVTQVREIRIGDLDPKRCDLVRHGDLPGSYHSVSYIQLASCRNASGAVWTSPRYGR